MLKSRHFNTVTRANHTVRKSGPSTTMRGEEYFYQNIPASISNMFPKLISSSQHGDQITIEMTFIHGTPCATLLAERLLTEHHLSCILRGLDSLHATETIDGTNDVNVYDNYVPKMIKRFTNARTMYAELQGSETVYNDLLDKLSMYQRHERGRKASVIHGDPVFSNMIYDRDTVTFIDMRGMVGDVPTLQGDAIYDFAKVYQSLCGYDIIVQRRESITNYNEYLRVLQDAFWKHMEARRVPKYDVLLVTISLLFSLFPLHDPNDGYIDALWALCVDLYEELTTNASTSHTVIDMATINCNHNGGRDAGGTSTSTQDHVFITVS